MGVVTLIRYDLGIHALHVGARVYPVKYWRSHDGYGVSTRQAVLDFENRWGLSIIWGSMNYGDNYHHHGPMGDIWEKETQPFVEQPNEVEVGVYGPEPTVLPGMKPETIELMREGGNPYLTAEAAESMMADRETPLFCDPFGWVDDVNLNKLIGYVMALPSHPTDDEKDGIRESLEAQAWQLV